MWSFLHTGIRRESCIRGVLNFRSNSGTVRRMRIQTPLPSRMSDFRRRRRLLSPLRCTYASLRRQYHHALGEKTHFSPSTKGSIVSFCGRFRVVTLFIFFNFRVSDSSRDFVLIELIFDSSGKVSSESCRFYGLRRGKQRVKSECFWRDYIVIIVERLRD